MSESFEIFFLGKVVGGELTGIEKIFNLMKDEQFRTLAEISKMTGVGEASVSAQIRNLKKPQFGGHDSDKKHLGGGIWIYRIIVNRGK